MSYCGFLRYIQLALGYACYAAKTLAYNDKSKITEAPIKTPNFLKQC